MTLTETDQPVTFSPYDYAIHEDPYPTYARLREEAPLYRNDEVDFWALSRHADVAMAFRDSARFSNRYGVSLDPQAWGPDAEKRSSFLGMDPPRHTLMRSLVSRGFTPRRVAELEPSIRALAARYLDAVEGGICDVIADFAAKLPMDVISEMIGVPPADRDEVRRLTDLVVHRQEGVHDLPPEGLEAVLSLVAYYTEMVRDRRARRTGDLTSALVDAEVDGQRLTDDDIVAFLFLMGVAGNETTTKLIGNAVYWAWRNPDQRASVWADPSRIPKWVEETLRYDTSSQMIARLVTCDVEMHGRTMREGDRLLLLIGSANRDPRVFPDPDRFDLDRDHSALLSFGVGRHYCLGASLARLEARVALEELVARWADYDLDPDGIVRVHSANVRGFANLPAMVTRR
jgi:cytochrome P450